MVFFRYVFGQVRRVLHDPIVSRSDKLDRQAPTPNLASTATYNGTYVGSTEMDRKKQHGSYGFTTGILFELMSVVVDLGSDPSTGCPFGNSK
jgi:hypothetical protein